MAVAILDILSEKKTMKKTTFNTLNLMNIHIPQPVYEDKKKKHQHSSVKIVSQDQ